MLFQSPHFALQVTGFKADTLFFLDLKLMLFELWLGLALPGLLPRNTNKSELVK